MKLNKIIAASIALTFSLAPQAKAEVSAQAERQIRQVLTPYCVAWRKNQLTNDQFLNYAFYLYGLAEPQNFDEGFIGRVNEVLNQNDVKLRAFDAAQDCLDGHLNNPSKKILNNPLATADDSSKPDTDRANPSKKILNNPLATADDSSKPDTDRATSEGDRVGYLVCGYVIDHPFSGKKNEHSLSSRREISDGAAYVEREDSKALYDRVSADPTLKELRQKAFIARINSGCLEEFTKYPLD